MNLGQLVGGVPRHRGGRGNYMLARWRDALRGHVPEEQVLDLHQRPDAAQVGFAPAIHPIGDEMAVGVYQARQEQPGFRFRNLRGVVMSGRRPQCARWCIDPRLVRNDPCEPRLLRTGNGTASQSPIGRGQPP